jgi:hypothetical protein
MVGRIVAPADAIEVRANQAAFPERGRVAALRRARNSL